MEVTSFLRVSLGSSIIQLHNSLVEDAHACVQWPNGDRAWGCNTEERRSVVRFFVSKMTHVKDIHTEVFPVYGGKCFVA
jgi:hypothetical protein